MRDEYLFSFYGESPHVVVEAHSNCLSTDMQTFSVTICDVVWLSYICVPGTKVKHNHQQTEFK